MSNYVISDFNQLKKILKTEPFWGGLHVLQAGKCISLLGHLISKSRKYLLRITRTKKSINDITCVLCENEFLLTRYNPKGFGEYVRLDPSGNDVVLNKTSEIFSYSASSIKNKVNTNNVIKKQRETFNKRAEDLVKLREKEGYLIKDSHSPAGI